MGRAKALSAWREHEARNKNIPRGRIIKDETLVDLVSHPPKQQSDLAKVRGLSTTWGGNDIGARLMAALTNAQPMDASEMPKRDENRPGLGKESALVADLLRLLLKIRAKEINVAPRLLARADDLDALAAGQREGLAVLQDWRFEQFGGDALALVEGRLGFTVRDGKLCMTRTAEEAVCE
jgi:ribonuclease D